jgi:hypothetical protein
MRKPFDFDFTVSSTHLASAGWKLETFHGSNPFQCHVVYVRDFKTGHVQIFSISKENFDSTPRIATSDEASGEIAKIIRRYAKGKVRKRDERLIGPALAIYVKGTQGYRIWKDRYGLEERIHALINIYQGSLLRPALIGFKGTILAADEYVQYSDQIAQIDKQKHPDWFK